MFGLYPEWYRSDWNVLLAQTHTHTRTHTNTAVVTGGCRHEGSESVCAHVSFSLRVYERLCFAAFAASTELYPYRGPEHRISDAAVATLQTTPRSRSF